MNVNVLDRDWNLKAMSDASHGVALSKSKNIKREFSGSIMPKVEIKAFHWVGHVCRTSNANIVDGDCAKSSTML